MNAPQVSVILPTYNRAAFLGTAMESVLGQSFADLELLVVDDGSVDGTQALVERHQAADARVHYLRQEHRGIGAAINAGIRAARGPYIARMDSDDRWLPDLLETEVAVLEARPEIGLVYGKAQWSNADLAPLTDTIGYAPHFPNETLRSMVWSDHTCNITVVVRRQAFDLAGGFDETLVTSGDWDMWLRVAVHYEFAFVDRVVALVRDHDSRSTGPQSGRYAVFLGTRHKVLDKFFARSDLPPGIASMKPVAYRNLYVYIGNMWLGAGEWRRALAAFAKALGTGANPVVTAARILWFTVAFRILSRTAAGRSFIAWESERRRCGRATAREPA